MVHNLTAFEQNIAEEQKGSRILYSVLPSFKPLGVFSTLTNMPSDQFVGFGNIKIAKKKESEKMSGVSGISPAIERPFCRPIQYLLWTWRK